MDNNVDGGTPLEQAIADTLSERQRAGVPGAGLEPMDMEETAQLLLKRSLQQAKDVRGAIQNFNNRLAELEARLNGIEHELGLERQVVQRTIVSRRQ